MRISGPHSICVVSSSIALNADILSNTRLRGTRTTRLILLRRIEFFVHLISVLQPCLGVNANDIHIRGVEKENGKVFPPFFFLPFVPSAWTMIRSLYLIKTSSFLTPVTRVYIEKVTNNGNTL